MKLKTIWFGGLLALVAFLLAVPASLAAPTTCNGGVISGVGSGLVTVPPGGTCTFLNAQRSGGVKATGALSVTFINSAISGGLDARNVGTVTLTGSVFSGGADCTDAALIVRTATTVTGADRCQPPDLSSLGLHW